MRIAGTAELFARRAPPPGSRPGHFEVPEDSHPTRIRALVYREGASEERAIASAEDLAAAARAPGVTWIEVNGLGDGSVLHWLRDALGIHPLAVADVANTGQRPKFEDYGEHDLIITQLVTTDEAFGVILEQVSLLTGPGFVVSVVERPVDIFEPIRERIRSGNPLICRMGPDFLTYALLDAVIDGYFPVVEELGDILDDLEEEITARPATETLSSLHAARRTLLAVHRVMFRQRDALAAMLRAEGSPFSEPVRVYLRDAHDHTLQVLDTVETYREMTIGLADVYLSSISHRLNEVMMTLTVIATIFIPLTFVVGVYGMNFDHMPELRWHYGYPGVWGVMIAIAAGLILWFRRRGWLGGQGGGGEKP